MSFVSLILSEREAVAKPLSKMLLQDLKPRERVLVILRPILKKRSGMSALTSKTRSLEMTRSRF